VIPRPHLLDQVLVVVLLCGRAVGGGGREVRAVGRHHPVHLLRVDLVRVVEHHHAMPRVDVREVERAVVVQDEATRLAAVLELERFGNVVHLRK